MTQSENAAYPDVIGDHHQKEGDLLRPPDGAIEGEAQENLYQVEYHRGGEGNHRGVQLNDADVPEGMAKDLQPPG